eukprot:15393525-Heterocapsa_arctica.AAC.1
MICDVRGCVVCPSQLFHDYSEIVHWASDLSSVDIKVLPMLFSAGVDPSFCLPKPVDQDLLHNIDSGFNLSFVDQQQSVGSAGHIFLRPERLGAFASESVDLSLRKGVDSRSVSGPTLSRGLDDIDFVSYRESK